MTEQQMQDHLTGLRAIISLLFVAVVGLVIGLFIVATDSATYEARYVEHMRTHVTGQIIK